MNKTTIKEMVQKNHAPQKRIMAYLATVTNSKIKIHLGKINATDYDNATATELPYFKWTGDTNRGFPYESLGDIEATLKLTLPDGTYVIVIDKLDTDRGRLQRGLYPIAIAPINKHTFKLIREKNSLKMQKLSDDLEYNLMFGNIQLAKIWWEKNNGYNGYVAALYEEEGSLIGNTLFYNKELKVHTYANEVWVYFGETLGFHAQIDEDGEVAVSIHLTYGDTIEIRHGDNALPEKQNLSDWAGHPISPLNELTINSFEAREVYADDDVIKMYFTQGHRNMTLPITNGLSMIETYERGVESISHYYLFDGAKLRAHIEKDRWKVVKKYFGRTTTTTIR